MPAHVAPSRLGSLDTGAARPDDPLSPARSAGDAAVLPSECAAMPAPGSFADSTADRDHHAGTDRRASGTRRIEPCESSHCLAHRSPHRAENLSHFPALGIVHPSTSCTLSNRGPSAANAGPSLLLLLRYSSALLRPGQLREFLASPSTIPSNSVGSWLPSTALP